MSNEKQESQEAQKNESTNEIQPDVNLQEQNGSGTGSGSELNEGELQLPEEGVHDSGDIPGSDDQAVEAPKEKEVPVEVIEEEGNVITGSEWDPEKDGKSKSDELSGSHEQEDREDMDTEVPSGVVPSMVDLFVSTNQIPHARPTIFDARNVNRIAKACYNVNKAYCEGIGDDSQPEWNDAAQWQVISCVNGVKFHLARPNATHEDSHLSWMREKLLSGWQYGEERDPEAKTHPNLVDYSELSDKQKVKDRLFKAVVDSLR